MSGRQFWFLFVVILVLLVLCFASAQRAHAGLMGGVGVLMGPTGGGGTVPGGGFAILTEAGDNLAAETGNILVLESAP